MKVLTFLYMFPRYDFLLTYLIEPNDIMNIHNTYDDDHTVMKCMYWPEWTWGRLLQSPYKHQCFMVKTNNSIYHHIYLNFVNSCWWSHFKIRRVNSKYFLMNAGVGSKCFQTTLESLQYSLKRLWSHFNMGFTWKCYTGLKFRDKSKKPDGNNWQQKSLCIIECKVNRISVFFCYCNI